MKTLTVCLISLALICFALDSATATTLTTNTISTASFYSAPVKVMDGSSGNTTDTPWQSYTNVAFGPGITNDTMYFWGVAVGSTTVKTICRKLNATMIAYGSDTVEASVPSGTSDSTQTATITAPRSTSPLYAVGPGYFGVATVQSNSAIAASVTMDSLVFYVVSPSSITSKTVAISSTAVTSASTTAYSFGVNFVWYEDGVFYILYEAQTGVTSDGTTTISISGIYVQGVLANSTTLYYNSAMAVTTSVAYTTTTADLGDSLTSGRGQNSYHTNSTSIYVLYGDLSGALAVVKGAILTRATGVVTSGPYCHCY